MSQSRLGRLEVAWQEAKQRHFWLEPQLDRSVREQIAARILRLLWGSIVVLSLLVQLAIVVTVRFSEPTRFIPGLVWILAVGASMFTARSKTALDAMTVLLGGLVASTGIAVLANSVHAPAYWSNILALAIVVPLYGTRGGVLLSLWCALCGAGWLLLRHWGYALPVGHPPSLFSYAFLLGCLAAGTGVMTIPTGLLSAALKASEQRRLEAVRAHRAEQNAELAFRAVFEQTGAVTALVEPNGTILRVNLMVERLLGVDETSLIGKTIFELPWVAPNSAERLEFALRLAVDGTERLDLEIVGAMGRRHHLQVAVAPVRSPDGQIRTLVLEALDATKFLETQRELAHARRLEALGQLAGGVAHDFNNMLLALQGALDAMRGSELDRMGRFEAIDTMEQAVTRATDLTHKLLAFGRRDRFETQRIEIDDLLGDAVRLIRRTLGAPIDLVLDLRADRAQVEGDGAAIEHALVNLMLNARDAMNGGGTVTVATRLLEVEAAWCDRQSFPIRPGSVVELSVTDDGVGMPEAVRSRVFEPFFTTKAVGRGSGLGLSAVHGTMLSHNGGITVESELGTGTTFRLYFPVAKSQPAPRVAPSGVDFSLKLSGKVLVVDDEPLVLRVAKRYLTALGIASVGVDSGEAAIAQIERGEGFNCVLTDIVMPKMGGAALVARLRVLQPNLPIVVMSGFPAGTNSLEPDVLADCPWLRKPFGRQELAQTLGPILQPERPAVGSN